LRTLQDRYLHLSLTSRVNKIGIVLACKKGIWKLAEELLQDPSNTVDVMEKTLWVGKVHFG
jgi:hypothetical protein